MDKLDKLRVKTEGLNFFKEATKRVAKYPVISECPVCHNDLHVERLACEHCSTKFEGQFTLSKFNYLDTDKLYFIELFVKNRGNIKAIEKEMNLSYPTIKKILDEVIVGLGYSLDSQEQEEPVVEEKGPKLSRVEILEKINSGELTVEAASQLLKKLK